MARENEDVMPASYNSGGNLFRVCERTERQGLLALLKRHFYDEYERNQSVQAQRDDGSSR